MAELVTDNLDLVPMVVAKLYPGASPDRREELVSCGHEGLVRAALNYDGTTHGSFRGYAYHRIRGAILDGVRALGPWTRRGIQGLRERPDEHARREASAECFAGAAFEGEEIVAKSSGAGQDDLLDEKLDAAAAQRSLKALNGRELLVVKRLFFEGEKQEDIAHSLGITPSGVSRIKSRALATLRGLNWRLLRRFESAPRRRAKERVVQHGEHRPRLLGPLGVRSMYRRNGRLKDAIALMALGLGNRAVSRETGMHRTTVRNLRLQLEEAAGTAFLCGCGLSAVHQGWCSLRFAKSEKRQAVVKRMHRAAAMARWLEQAKNYGLADEMASLKRRIQEREGRA